MALKLSAYLTYFLCVLITSGISQELLESHQAVLSILKSDNYSSNLVPPVAREGNASNPLKVYLNLGLRDIESIDDHKMELKTQLSLRQKWVDPRLHYPSASPSTYITLNSDIATPPWTPDIFIQNEKGSDIHRITRPNSFFRIYPNGTLFYSTRLTLTVACYMDLRRFPFDRQACDIRLASYAYTASTLELDWDYDVGLEQIHGDGSHHLTRFQVVGQASGRCLLTSSTGQYSTVYVRVTFQRETAFYTVQVFIPCTMLIVITWVSFWLGNAKEARLSLTVTVLLTLSTQISGTNQALSHISHSTAYSYFSGACLTFAAFSIFESATIVFLQGEGGPFFRGRNKGKVEDPEKGAESGLNSPAERLDRISRILFPVAFALYMAVYFGFYCGNWDEFSSGEGNGENKNNNLCGT